MGIETINESYDFYELKWDTEFFGVNCAKAILHKPLTLDEFNELKDSLKNYQFVSIEIAIPILQMHN